MLTLSSRVKLREVQQLFSPWLIRADVAAHIFVEMINTANSFFGKIAEAKSIQDGGGIPVRTESGRMVVNIVGPILRRDGILSTLLGLPTYKSIQSVVEKAKKDSSVSEVVFVIDSPGGVASGCQETAAAIRSLSQTKNTVAFIDGMGTSAAYWLASACNKVYASPSSEVGSVGAILLRPEYANPDEEGNSVAVFASGEHKKDFVGYAPINEGIALRLQSYVDEIGGAFVDKVAEYRNLSDEARLDVANAGIFTATSAVEKGLIDGIISDVSEIGGFDKIGGDVIMENVGEEVTVNYEPDVQPQETVVAENLDGAVAVGQGSQHVLAEEVEALRREIYELKVVSPFLNAARDAGIVDGDELAVMEKLVRTDESLALAVLEIFKRRKAVFSKKIDIVVKENDGGIVIRPPLPVMEVKNV